MGRLICSKMIMWTGCGHGGEVDMLCNDYMDREWAWMGRWISSEIIMWTGSGHGWGGGYALK
jgi:hypothetical protein